MWQTALWPNRDGIRNIYSSISTHTYIGLFGVAVEALEHHRQSDCRCYALSLTTDSRAISQGSISSLSY